MAIIFITGMSGTGKSSVLVELARRGHAVVDTDYGPWIEEVFQPGDLFPERFWREEQITALLDSHTEGHLFIQGTVPNQGTFYPRFDAVVLLSAPLDVLLDRIASRDTNDFGKTPEERDQIIRDFAEIEPILRAGATHEIDTRKPLSEVADELESIVAGYTCI